MTHEAFQDKDWGDCRVRGAALPLSLPRES